MDAIFLGINQAGKEIYNWLNQKKDLQVKALLTEKHQLETIKNLKPDIVISSGFEHKIPKEIIEIPEKGIINLHPSFLPYNQGAHPYIHPIIDKTPAGLTIHYMNEKIDEGPVIAKREVPIHKDDTGKTLHHKLMEEQIRLFKQEWQNIIQNPETEKQENSKGTKHRKKELENLRKIDLQEKTTNAEIIDKLRALSYPPHKNAYFEYKGEKYFLNLEITKEN